MRVYYNPMSPYCHKLLYFLEEAGLTYEPVLVEFSSFDFKEPQFLTISPAGQIPAIESAFGHIADSTVCMRYLCDRHQLNGFYPSNLEDRAAVDFWTEYVNQHISRYIMSLSWQRHWMPKRNLPIDQKAVVDSLVALEKYLPALERHLLHRNFFAGAQLTIADINLAAFLYQCHAAQFDLSGFSQIDSWFARIQLRPAWNEFTGKYL